MTPGGRWLLKPETAKLNRSYRYAKKKLLGLNLKLWKISVRDNYFGIW